MNRRDYETLSNLVEGRARGFIPSASPGKISYNNTIAMIVEVHDDFLIDVYAPYLGTVVKRIPMEQPFVGESVGDIISPSKGDFCLIYKSSDNRWVAKPGVNFKEGESPRDLKVGEMERYTKGTSVKHDLGGTIHISGGDTRVSLEDKLNVCSNSINVDLPIYKLLVSSVTLEGTIYPIKREVLFQGWTDKEYTREYSEELLDTSLEAVSAMRNSINDLREAFSTAEFPEVMRSVKEDLSTFEGKRVPLVIKESGVVMDASGLELSDLEKVSPEDIIKSVDHGLCVYRERRVVGAVISDTRVYEDMYKEVKYAKKETND